VNGPKCAADNQIPNPNRGKKKRPERNALLLPVGEGKEGPGTQKRDLRPGF